MSSKICPVCGKEFGFGFQKSRLEKQLCCSPSCRQKAKANSAKRETIICVVCGKQFESWVYRKSTCCSRKCASKRSNGVPKPTARKPEIHVIRQCLICGKPYETTTHQIRLRGSVCCSKQCAHEYQSQYIRGDRHHAWKGGKTRFPNRGSNWGKQRKAALNRDNHTCQICGRKPKHGEKRVVAVHHIKPYREFNGDYITANELTNLITLCRRCHVNVEDYGFPCPKRLF